MARAVSPGRGSSTKGTETEQQIISRFPQRESTKSKRKLVGSSLEIFGFWKLPEPWENHEVSY